MAKNVLHVKIFTHINKCYMTLASDQDVSFSAK